MPSPLTDRSTLMWLGLAAVGGAVVVVVVGAKKLVAARGKVKTAFDVTQPPQLRLFTIKDRVAETHNTWILRLGLPRGCVGLGVPAGKHISITQEINGKAVTRSYTPITSDYELRLAAARGQQPVWELLYKEYKKTEKFPKGGLMSQRLTELPVGSSMEVKGATGLTGYVGGGETRTRTRTLKSKHIGLIAGGTGVTPMVQVIKKVLLDDPAPEEEPIRLYLICAHSTTDDLLCKSFLEHVAKKFPTRFKLFFACSKVNEDEKELWGYPEGRVNKTLLMNFMPAPAADPYFLLCGPSGLVRQCCMPLLSELGHAEDRCLAL